VANDVEKLVQVSRIKPTAVFMREGAALIDQGLADVACDLLQAQVKAARGAPRRTVNAWMRAVRGRAEMGMHGGLG
jgi:hypothetical protein